MSEVHDIPVPEIYNNDGELVCPDDRCDGPQKGCFKNEFGLGRHLTVVHEDDEVLYELGRELMSGDNAPNSGRDLPDEWVANISKGLEGNNYAEGKNWSHDEETRENYKGPKSEEHKQRISEAKKRHWEDEEYRQKVSESLKEAGTWSPGSGRTEKIFIEELEGYVQGRLEEKVAYSLLEEFDSSVICIQSEYNYIVDFVVDDAVVIEAKGRLWEGNNCVEKGQVFMDEYPEITYVVLGQSEETKEIPNDRWFSDEEMDKMMQFIKEETQ